MTCKIDLSFFSLAAPRHFLSHFSLPFLSAALSLHLSDFFLHRRLSFFPFHCPYFFLSFLSLTAVFPLSSHSLVCALEKIPSTATNFRSTSLRCSPRSHFSLPFLYFLSSSLLLSFSRALRREFSTCARKLSPSLFFPLFSHARKRAFF